MYLPNQIPCLVVSQEVIDQLDELQPEPDMKELFKGGIALQEGQNKDQV